MKRGFQGGDQLDSITMANCLVLLSQGGSYEAMASNIPSRVFECKTCNRQFPSFQALGGHRASHKKPRLMGSEGNATADRDSSSSSSSPGKPKTHECSICGLEFAIGQALGGHMRRHRAGGALTENHHSPPPPRPPPSLDLVKRTSTDHTQAVPLVKKLANNSRRVLCLDLNLTPMENDLQSSFSLQKPAPIVDFFL